MEILFLLLPAVFSVLLRDAVSGSKSTLRQLLLEIVARTLFITAALLLTWQFCAPAEAAFGSADAFTTKLFLTFLLESTGMAVLLAFLDPKIRR